MIRVYFHFQYPSPILGLSSNHFSRHLVLFAVSLLTTLLKDLWSLCNDSKVFCIDFISCVNEFCCLPISYKIFLFPLSLSSKHYFLLTVTTFLKHVFVYQLSSRFQFVLFCPL